MGNLEAVELGLRQALLKDGGQLLQNLLANALGICLTMPANRARSVTPIAPRKLKLFLVPSKSVAITSIVPPLDKDASRWMRRWD